MVGLQPMVGLQLLQAPRCHGEPLVDETGGRTLARRNQCKPVEYTLHQISRSCHCSLCFQQHGDVIRLLHLPLLLPATAEALALATYGHGWVPPHVLASPRVLLVVPPPSPRARE